MIPGLPCLHLARVTVETRTPLSLGTGLGAGLYDTALVRDANGLPAIPGTSIAGVLRHIHSALYGKDETDSLFGRAKERTGKEQPSRVHVSWAAIHDASDRPVDGLVTGQRRRALESDTILSIA